MAKNSRWPDGCLRGNNLPMSSARHCTPFSRAIRWDLATCAHLAPIKMHLGFDFSMARGNSLHRFGGVSLRCHFGGKRQIRCRYDGNAMLLQRGNCNAHLYKKS